ncbi:MAG: multicopper oxidase domain-containing protein [bacterium]
MNRNEFLRNLTHGLAACSILPSLTYCTLGDRSNTNSAGNTVNKSFNPDLDVELHGLQFQIIERDVSQMQQDVWETVKDGFIDEGWQDTFLLMPGMKVKIALKFEDYTGIYVYHCHNLEHEDMGMMRNFEVIG